MVVHDTHTFLILLLGFYVPTLNRSPHKYSIVDRREVHGHIELLDSIHYHMLV